MIGFNPNKDFSTGKMLTYFHFDICQPHFLRIHIYKMCLLLLIEANILQKQTS